MMPEIMSFLDGSTIVHKFAVLSKRVRTQARILTPFANSRVVPLKLIDTTSRSEESKSKDSQSEPSKVDWNVMRDAFKNLLEFTMAVQLRCTEKNVETIICIIEWITSSNYSFKKASQLQIWKRVHLISDLKVSIPPSFDIYHRTYQGTGITDEYDVHSNDYINLRYEHLATAKHWKEVEFPNCEEIEFEDCNLEGLFLVGLPNVKTIKVKNCVICAMAFNFKEYERLESV